MMKRTHIIKYLLFLVSIVLWGCSEEIYKDISDNQEMATSLTIEKAKDWYETNFLSSGSDRSFKTKNTDSTVFVLKPLLNWDLAELDNDSLWSVVELPWQYENGKVTMTNPEVSSYAINNQVKVEQVIRLVILKNRKTGEIYGFKMVVVPDLEYVLSKGGEINSNDYFDRDTNLSGMVMYYSVDDKFVNGWQYKNGTIIGSIVEAEPKANSNIQRVSNQLIFMVVQVCSLSYAEAGGKRYYNEDCEDRYFASSSESGGNSSGTSSGGYDTYFSGGVGSGDGSTSGQGTTNTTAISTANTPCVNLMAMSKDPNFHMAIANLESSTNKNYEVIKTLKIDKSGTYIFSSEMGPINKPEASIDVIGTIDALLHSHYDGTLRIFSPDDLKTMYANYLNGHMKPT